MNKKVLFGTLTFILILVAVWIFVGEDHSQDQADINVKSSKVAKDLTEQESEVAEEKQNIADESIPTKALPVTTKKQKLYSEILKVTGSENGSLKDVLKGVIDPDSEAGKKLLEAMEGFDYDAELEKAILSVFSEDELEDILAFSKEPIVQEVNKTNKELMSSPEAVTKMQEYMKEFDYADLGEERKGLLNDVVESSKAYDVAQLSVYNMLKSSVMSSSGDISYEEKLQQYESVKKNYDQKMNWDHFKKQIDAATYYALRGLSDEQMREYANTLMKSNISMYNRQTALAQGKVMGKFFQILKQNK